jgi:tRNA-dihydrouridine synthase B
MQQFSFPAKRLDAVYTRSMTLHEATFHIGSLPIHGEVILAPMDGISDLPFRNLCRQFGSAMSYVPFIHARDLLEGQKRAVELLRFLPEERPVALQLYDNRNDNLLKAAHQLLKYEPDVIDINMACSIRSISARGAGAGMLRDPSNVQAVIATLTREMDIPITIKIRLGWDEHSLNYLEISRIAEESGAALIAVHARTRQQHYTGSADWDAIAAIKQAVSIPVIGNGDVRNFSDIRKMKSHTDCDAVMIGRAAIGNPWIFARRPRSKVPRAEVGAVLDRHLESMLLNYPEQKAILLLRKHLVRYMEPFDIDASLRQRILTCQQASALRSLLREAGLAVNSSGV